MKKLLSYAGCLTMLLSFAACATTPELPPPPPKYVYKDEKAAPATANSLWSDRASFYEDNKARRLNDLVTILVSENITGTGKADSATSKDSSLDAAVQDFFGAPLNLNSKNFYGKGQTFSPTAKGYMKDDFKGSGSTSRTGTLVGTITAKVVEVMPNGLLALESRKDITLNNEKQTLVLRGIIRPDDIAIDNTIASGKVTDAQIFFVGDGIIGDKQSPGWFVRFMDKVWPF